MKVYSTGQAAKLIGLDMIKVRSMFRSGAPKPKMRVQDRCLFTEEDIIKLHEWFVKKGIPVTEPKFTVEAE